jgi:hypothetical protein
LNPLLTFSSGITNAQPSHLIKNEGDILIDTEYQNVLKIYTDGSKDPQNNTNGCAFVIPELKVSTLYIEPLIACNAESESINITVFNGLKS